MSNFNQLLNTFKQAAVEAVEAKKPVQVCFGKVEDDTELKVIVEQKMTLSKAQLIITDTVVNANLQKGDEVVLLRVQGGQKYIIMDKIGGDGNDT